MYIYIYTYAYLLSQQALIKNAPPLDDYFLLVDVHVQDNHIAAYGLRLVCVVGSEICVWMFPISCYLYNRGIYSKPRV